MIRLEEIHRNNRNIMCNAFVEDCTVPVFLSFDEHTNELADYTLPADYKYCKSHIMHARKYLKSLHGKEIKEHSKTIMWY